jgi:hypothetical protein
MSIKSVKKIKQCASLKGTVLRKLSWVQSCHRQLVILQRCGDGLFFWRLRFVILLSCRLELSINPLPVRVKSWSFSRSKSASSSCSSPIGCNSFGRSLHSSALVKNPPVFKKFALIHSAAPVAV